MNNDEIFDSVLSHSRGYSMGSLWQSLDVELSDAKVNYQEQTDIFLLLLRSLLCRGQIRLALDGEYIAGDVDHQLQVLRRAWPNSKGELEADMGLWFLVNAPAGIVWITREGQEIWT
jgi:hypothetical protein